MFVFQNTFIELQFFEISKLVGLYRAWYCCRFSVCPSVCYTL